ncbi:MAG: GTP cyclohydrolase I FolE2 [Myxococcales bacterium]|nr:GTP cyclohydrolase I FolE2 [Myxococcales bacterium]MCB9531964.1 GTP cyclohydrolase I FolE2 [Myxococcales bacterium]MCB9532823.1 GTP cyclohydrolase I FolE2 [Myxococcales bacterium]
MTDALEDIQSGPDDRNIPLRQVGVVGLRYPVTVWDRSSERQQTVGTFKLTVDLPHQFKGTHMSRFVAALERHRGEMSLETMPELVDDLRTRLDAERAHVRMEFPYFVRKAAPVSGVESALEVRCWFVGDAEEREALFTLGVDVPVMTVCPCSRAISDRGAHCQRSHARISVRFRELVWIEELVEIAEAAASAPLYPFLKREDEKWVTERSYDNPVFVEDLVRNIAARLRDDARIQWFYVEAENEESIHTHNAYAAVGSADLE